MTNLFQGVFSQSPAKEEVKAKVAPLPSFAPRPDSMSPGSSTPATGVSVTPMPSAPACTTPLIPLKIQPVSEVEEFDAGVVSAEFSNMYYGEYGEYGGVAVGGNAEPTKKENIQDPNVPTAEEQLAAQFYSYHIGMEGVEGSNKTHKVILAGDGAFILKRVDVNGNKGSVLTPISKIPGLPKFGKGKAEIEIVNKLPVRILRQLLADFHAIHKLQSTEAAAQVFKNKDGEYEIYYPEQEVSGGTARYRNDQDNAAQRWGDNELVLEVHSHNSMGAFFSATDDANEVRPGIYGVFGMFGCPRAAFVCRFRYEKIDTSLNLRDIFDIGDTPESEAMSLVGLPEPDQRLIERAKRSNPVAANFARSLDRTGSAYGIDAERYHRYYGRGEYGLDEFYDHFRYGMDEDIYPISKHKKPKVPKTAKKAKSSKNKTVTIDAMWVVKAIDDPTTIRRLIVALDDKLGDIQREQEKNAQKAQKDAKEKMDSVVAAEATDAVAD